MNGGAGRSHQGGSTAVGGGGGGGGFNGNGAGSSLAQNSGDLQGGSGGAGGAGFGDGGGGGGGAGGYGAVATDGSGTTISNAYTITGGMGGAGGTDSAHDPYNYGAGGDGGVGVFFVQSGVSFTNSGAIQGGAGGASAGIGYHEAISAPGRGGSGIVGAGLTIRNSGTIAGGDAGITTLTGSVQPNIFPLAGDGIEASGSTIVNARGGTISGGDGDENTNNQSGDAGAGIRGSNLTIVNNGTIAAGFYGGDSSNETYAIIFEGGNNSLTLGGVLQGAIRLAGNLSFADSGTLASDLVVANFSEPATTISAKAGVKVVFEGDLSENFGRVVFGSATDTGTLVFGSAATGSLFGPVEVAGGVLTAVAGNRSLGGITASAKSTEVDEGATLDFGGNNATIKRLTGAGTLLNRRGGTTTIEDGAFDGKIVGAGAVEIADRATLSGASTYAGATTVDANATLTLQADAALGGTRSVRNLGLIEKTESGAATLSGMVANAGKIEVAAGTLDVTGAVDGRGVFDIGQDARLVLGGAVGSHQTVDFGTGDQLLRIEHANNFDGSISKFRHGDEVALTGFSDMAKVMFDASHGGGTLTVTDGAHHFEAHLDGKYNARDFSLTHASNGEVIHYK